MVQTLSLESMADILTEMDFNINESQTSCVKTERFWHRWVEAKVVIQLWQIWYSQGDESAGTRPDY